MKKTQPPKHGVLVLGRFVPLRSVRMECRNMSLIVNRRDLDFVLYEMLDIETLFQTDRYRACDRETITGLFDVAENIATNTYLPCAALVDDQEPKFIEGKVRTPPEVAAALQTYAEAGLYGASFDTEMGGLQLPYVVTMAMNGMFLSANLGIAGYSFLTVANANLLASFGSEEQKAQFLAPMVQGKWFGTMCLSEPQAGSSLSDIRTRAEPVGDGLYRISGSKMWISGGDQEISENIVHLVLAKIPGGLPGVKGISLFIVPKFRVRADGSIGERNDVALAGLNHKMGYRATTNCLLNFGENDDCLGYLVGEPNKGLSYMFHMMNEARTNVGYCSVMSALAGYLYSLDYARTRVQGRLPGQKNPASPQVPIIEHADVKRMLMAQKAAVEGGLALCAYCALLVDRKKVATAPEDIRRLELLLEILTPIAKSWPAEHCLEANKLAIQVLGGYGYTRDYPLERLYRDNRLNHIHEGTFGVQALDLLGRKVRMDGGDAFTLLLETINEIVARADDVPDLADEVAAIRSAITAVERATKAVLECTYADLGLANATLYLDAFGHIVIAWIWLWQAMTAREQMQSNPDDADLYRGKLAACRYFYRYELPRVNALLAVVEALDDTCFGLRPTEFLGV